MAQNVVSKNFISCLQKLKELGTVKSDREFAGSLDFTPQNLSQIIKGKRDVTLELLRKSVEVYSFNTEFLFSGEGELFSYSHSSQSSNGLSLSSLPYIDNSLEEKYIDSIKSDIDPQLKGFYYNGAELEGDARIFRVQNRDLTPFINAGDRLITKRLPKERWKRLVRDNSIYVVVCVDHIRIGRVINNILNNKTLQIIRDSSSSLKQEIFAIDDILEIWEITHVLIRWSQDLNGQKETMNEKLMNFNISLVENRDAIQELNKTIQKVLKQNRSQFTII